MDHQEKIRRKANPRETANILSLVTFSYIVPLLKKAFKHDLQEEDLYEVLHCCNSKRCGDKLEKLWKKLVKYSKPSIVRLLWKRFGWRYAWMCSINVVWKTSRSIIEPYALTNFISYFSQGQTKMIVNDAYYYGAMVIIVNLSQRFYFNNFLLWLEKLGVEIKTSFTSLLYRKSLKLSPTAVSEITMGNMVTLITKDVQMLKEAVYIVSSMASGMVQVCVICYLIFAKVGMASFFGIGILIAAMPLQIFIGKWVKNLRLITGKKTDERLQVTQETLSAIKVIKMYTWELFFENKINDARRKELTRMLLEFYLRSILIIVGALSSNLGLYVLIIAHIWMGSSTDPTVIFYLVTNFKELKRTIGVDLPRNIGRAAEMISATTRMNEVLAADELHFTSPAELPLYKPVVELKRAVVRSREREILNDVSLKVVEGLTIVTGPVGSGKSSLLRAVLKENPLSSGQLNLCGSISYASQDPWLFPSTIKQNIIFGEEFDESRYQQVIRVCALHYDLNVMQMADDTIVTDNGSNLSKGQRTRINLARAIYKNSDIYLLDDSLSSLDNKVQDYIFNECIKTHLKGKICIFVSQNANHISRADSVVVMDMGRIKEIGKPSEEILQAIEEVSCEDLIREELVNDDDIETEIDESTKLMTTVQTRKECIYREKKKEGKVLIGIYHKYIVFGGGFIMLFINLALGGVAQVSGSFADKFLTMWVDEKQNVLTLKGNFSQDLNISMIDFTLNQTLLEAEAQETRTFIFYSILLLTATILMLVTTYVNFNFCRRASINIHKAFVSSVTKATSSFFDSHFIGNVLNRFSEDLAQLDENFPFIFRELLEDMFSIMGQISLVLTVDTHFLVYISLVFIILLILGRIYIPAGRSLKRLEASSRSPMIGHLNASLEGLVTIRAQKAEGILKDDFDRNQDVYTSAFYTSICSISAFTFFMDITCSSLIIVVVIHFLFIDSGASGGNVGLALTQVSMLGSTIQYAIRKLSVLENSMTSVERIVDYTEIASENYGGKTLENWPTMGGVKFQNVSLSYNNEIVLKNVSFEVEPKQKIGIVGRTGAGKTSMISSIFRLYDIQGHIFIDGVDIKTLSLKFFRGKLAVIPQDPVLFSGTVRSNIDPFREFDDKDLWSVLEKVNLKSVFPNLDMKITNRSNFSSGQKQLFSLARTLLKGNKILILDEPSENMDTETHAMVHGIIKRHFRNCTIFMIAHRLESILEYDKVLVLDRGAIQEFESPSNLIEAKNGSFYELVKQAGLLNYLSRCRGEK